MLFMSLIAYLVQTVFLMVILYLYSYIEIITLFKVGEVGPDKSLLPQPIRSEYTAHPQTRSQDKPRHMHQR
jgi:hypothetical protein